MDASLKVSLSGKDVKRNKEQDLAFSSKLNQWKTAKIYETTATIPATPSHDYSGWNGLPFPDSGYDPVEVTIPHGQLYPPAFTVWFKGTTNYWGMLIPAIQALNFTEEFPYSGQMWADDINIHLNLYFYNKKTATEPTHQLNIKAFIYYDKLEE